MRLAFDHRMRKIEKLDATEIRVLGALLEKEQTTPEYYPLTVNALIAACNQKSNRSPVTSLSETEVVEALDAMRQHTLVWRSEGARSERWSQSISRRLELDSQQKALLTVLMLRGAQTVGELRSRTHRMYDFQDLGQIEAALERMAAEERELVARLPRAPGQKEERWTQLLGGEIEALSPAQTVVAPAVAATAPADEDRIARLEERVRSLEDSLEALEQRLDPH